MPAPGVTGGAGLSTTPPASTSAASPATYRIALKSRIRALLTGGPLMVGRVVPRPGRWGQREEDGGDDGRAGARDPRGVRVRGEAHGVVLGGEERGGVRAAI